MQVVNEDVHGFNGDALHGQIPDQRIDVVSDDAGAAVVHGRTPLQLAVQPHKFIHALFIFVLRWGVVGAGLASLLSRMVISLILFAKLYQPNEMLQMQIIHQWRLCRQTA